MAGTAKIVQHEEAFIEKSERRSCSLAEHRSISGEGLHPKNQPK